MQVNRISDFEDKRIVVCSEVKWGGSGDISCGAKIINFLIDLGIKKEHITLMSNVSPEFVANFDANLRYVKIEKLSEQILQEKPDLVITAPTLHNLQTIASLNIPFLPILEYGGSFNPTISHADKVMVMGPRKRELGIMIDPALHEWSQSPEATYSKGRLRQLESLPAKLQTSILGEAFSERIIEKFNEQSRLYFGYVFNSQNALFFVQAITLMANKNEDQKDLCFFFPGSKILGDERSDTDHWLRGKFMECIAELGVKEVQQVNSATNERESISVPGAKGEKRITLIYGRVSHQDFCILLKASEKETIVTGDQSLSEAISVKKRFFYETLDHKINLLWSLIKIMEKCTDEDESALMRYLVNYMQTQEEFASYEVESKSLRLTPRLNYELQVNPDALAAFFCACQNNGRDQQAWEAFLNKLCNQRALAPKLQRIVASLLI